MSPPSQKYASKNDPKKEHESVSNQLGNKASPSGKQGSQITNDKVKSNDTIGDFLGNRQDSRHKNGSKRSQ
ncbi:hypothetical protein JHK82_044661 [Glycine max]|uniref:Uncharacterized protein n=2 Tax=Glycine subgen. Soja TaxID=1462606 RepID=A0A0R0FWQ1_SOYBN|nr:hypothetical protein JHK86_045060 [Glycine max]KAG4940980.1 hypothetical protein JHK87_044851 [Glycine soja]KAG4951761.1 hypothetical protein JHK85_045628 [Glycine max]KAG5099609.1 hypothetical protein JHK82_044661 [Glycine max]KAG5108209.1 hypothetical protein JHK84_045116 [Glycine max]